MKAFLFPGQGAQRVGMGAELFARFAHQVAEADAILGYSIADLCLNGPMEKLTRTNFTQVALYVVSALKFLDQTERPDVVLGHSVGEYAALFAAGVVDFATGLKLVKKRGELMDRAQGGGMAAVIGLDADQIKAVLRQHDLADIHPANFNTPRQIVLSGKRDAVVAAEDVFRAAGASHYVVLPVGGAFHTPFMAEAQAEFAGFATQFTFGPPQVPVISNVTARPHDPAQLRARMVEQITAPVQWCESLRYLLAKGMRFEDVTEIGDGPPVVKPMVRRTEAEAGPLDPAILAAEEQHQAVADDTPAGLFSLGNLGSRRFCDDFRLTHPYVCGAMYQGISSVEMVVRMGRAGMLAFFGAGGLPMPEIEAAIEAIRAQLPENAPFGVNFIAHVNHPHLEDQLVDLLLKHGVRVIEASAFMEVTIALVRWRAHGLRRENGRIMAHNRIMAKVSRPDVAAAFLAPAPEKLVAKLVQSGAISATQAEMLAQVPMADAVTVESDSGGHTDQGMPFTLIPAVLRVRDAGADAFPNFAGRVHVGAGGGIGTPEAAAAVLVLGAEYIVTGSINQATIEAGTSDAVKDMLEAAAVHDMTTAPSGEMFELGSKVQVLKKGLFFPARAEKLVAVYRQFESLDSIDATTRRQLEERFFQRPLMAVWDDVRNRLSPEDIERAERLPKHKMALVFRRYFKNASRWALDGDTTHKVDFQIHCGPALGAFNQWVAGTALESWRNRHVDDIALRLLDATAQVLNQRFAVLTGRRP